MHQGIGFDVGGFFSIRFFCKRRDWHDGHQQSE
jgi:hypothetical protein